MKGQVQDPSRSRGMTVIQRSRLGASPTHLGRGDRTAWPLSILRFSRGGISAWFPPEADPTGGCSIFDGVSGPRSGLYEDFIEREKGLGTLRRYVKGQVLDPSRSRGMSGYTKVPPRRICDRGVSGPRSGLYEDFIEREKGLGTLRRYVKGQVLDPSRSRGMTVIQRSRLGGSATG